MVHEELDFQRALVFCEQCSMGLPMASWNWNTGHAKAAIILTAFWWSVRAIRRHTTLELGAYTPSPNHAINLPVDLRIVAPFPHVTVHVVKSQSVGGIRTNLAGPFKPLLIVVIS